MLGTRVKISTANHQKPFCRQVPPGLIWGLPRLISHSGGCFAGREGFGLGKNLVWEWKIAEREGQGRSEGNRERAERSMPCGRQESATGT